MVLYVIMASIQARVHAGRCLVVLDATHPLDEQAACIALIVSTTIHSWGMCVGGDLV
jgi:hypothetical protein